MFNNKNNITNVSPESGGKMRINTRGLFFCLLLFGFCLAANAQTINLEQARLLALASSQSLARYETQIQSSLLTEQNHLYSMIPQLSASYSASMSFLQRNPQTQDTEFVNPFDNLTAGLSVTLSQVLFQGGKLFLQKAINSIQTESIRNNALAEYFKVLDTVDRAYYAVLEAAAAYESTLSSLEGTNMALSYAEVRFQNGIIDQNQYRTALLQKERDENNRSQRQRALALNMTALRELIGVTGAIELEPVSFDEYEDVLKRLAVISNEEADILFDDLWSLLVSSNPSITNAALNSRRAELNYSSIARDYAPTINLSLSSNLFSYSPAGGFTGPSGSGSVSIRGTIPLDFWVLSNKIERERISRDSTLNEYGNTQKSLESELISALYNIFSQAGSVLYLRRSLEINESSYASVFERYRLSQSSVRDLMDESTRLIESQNSLNSASFTFLRNLSTLRTLCALDDEEKLIKILLGTL